MQIGQQVVELVVRDRRAGHGAVAMENGDGHPLVSRRRAGGHGFDFSDGLQARSVEALGGGGIVAARETERERLSI